MAKAFEQENFGAIPREIPSTAFEDDTFGAIPRSPATALTAPTPEVQSPPTSLASPKVRAQELSSFFRSAPASTGTFGRATPRKITDDAVRRRIKSPGISVFGTADVFTSQDPAITEGPGQQFVKGIGKGIARQTQIPVLLGKELAPPETTAEKTGEAIGRTTEAIIELVGVGAAFRGVGLVGQGLFGKAGQVALQFGAQESTQQLRKFVAQHIHDDDFGFEGGKAVLKSMAFGAAFSIAASGLGAGTRAIWSKLKPSEQAHALKVLGLKKGASLDKINIAARKLASKTHPDKVEGMRQQFDKVINARDLLREEVRQNVIVRGAAPTAEAVSRGGLLPGEVAAEAAPTAGAIQPTSQVHVPAAPTPGQVVSPVPARPRKIAFRGKSPSAETDIEGHPIVERGSSGAPLLDIEQIPFSEEVPEGEIPVPAITPETPAEPREAAPPATVAEPGAKAPAAEEGGLLPDPIQENEIQLPGFGTGSDADGNVFLTAVFENPSGGSVHRNVFQLSEEQAQEFKDAESLPNKERFAIQNKIQTDATEQYNAAQAQPAPAAETKRPEAGDAVKNIEETKKAIEEHGDFWIKIDVSKQGRSSPIMRASEYVKNFRKIAEQALEDEAESGDILPRIVVDEDPFRQPFKVPGEPPLTEAERQFLLFENEMSIQEVDDIDPSEARLSIRDEVENAGTLQELTGIDTMQPPVPPAGAKPFDIQQRVTQFWQEVFPTLSSANQQKAREALSKVVGETITSDNQQKLLAQFTRGNTAEFFELSRDEKKLIILQAELAQAQPASAVEVKKLGVPKGTRDVLGGVDPVISLNQALRDAKALRPRTEAEQTRERGRRFGRAEATTDTLIAEGVRPGEAIGRGTGQLKGKLSDLRFEPIRGALDSSSPGTVDSLISYYWDRRDLHFTQRLDLNTAFNSLIDGESITLRQVDMLAQHFGIEMGKIAESHASPDNLLTKAVTLWRAGLLTGMKTQALNATSNLTHALTETGKDIPAAAVDTLASLVTGKRTVAFTTKGSLSGFVEGTQKGFDYLNTGVDERNIGEKLDYTRVNFGTSKFARALQAYEETVFHMMGAADQPFFYGAKARSLQSQALAQAKNAGVKGDARVSFIQNLLEGPKEKTFAQLAKEGLVTKATPQKKHAVIQAKDFTAQKEHYDEMLKYAVIDAETAVFQNQTDLGDLGRRIQKFTPRGIPVGEIIVPFSRTPSAVATQIINYTPIGPISEVFEQVRQGRFDQRRFSQAVGRGVVGTGVLALGVAMFKKDMITLGFPKDERERELWKIEGRKANSIKIGDKWRSAQVLGPVGNVLLIGGYFQEAFDKTGSPSEAISRAALGSGKSFMDQTFVTNANKLAQAITDPERSGTTFFEGMAGSMVPRIIHDIARANDTSNRRVSGDFGNRVKQSIQKGLPVFRQGLEPKIDVFGNDLPKYGGNALEVMIDPTRPVKIKQDLVVDELRTLWDQGIKVSPTLLGDKQGYPEVLNPEENTALWRRSGQLTYTGLNLFINAPSYQALTPEEKGKQINGFVNAAKNFARAEAVRSKVAQGVSLGDLKTSGLMSFNVFKLHMATPLATMSKQDRASVDLTAIYTNLENLPKPTAKKK